MQHLHGLSVDVGGSAPPLGSHDLQVLLFQLVRELLFNIVKHAGVDRAFVAIRHDDDHLTIEVRDDGVGFSPDALEAKQAAGGFGLYSVRERLPLFGGHLEIMSQPGEGTRAVITLPLPT
jgi:signal transduction histidine kinase